MPMKIKSYFEETYYVPLDRQMCDLIRTKIYLLASDLVPESFQQFLTHTARLECLHRLFQDKGINSRDIDNPYPEDFKKEVEHTLNELKGAYMKRLRQTT